MDEDIIIVSELNFIYLMKETEKFYRKKYPKVQTLSAMDIEIISILDDFKNKDVKKISFKDAPDGARFKYPDRNEIWVKINSHPKSQFCDGNGLLARWNGNVKGYQSYCSFCDKESGIDFNTVIELV